MSDFPLILIDLLASPILSSMPQIKHFADKAAQLLNSFLTIVGTVFSIFVYRISVSPKYLEHLDISEIVLPVFLPVFLPVSIPGYL